MAKLLSHFRNKCMKLKRFHSSIGQWWWWWLFLLLWTWLTGDGAEGEGAGRSKRRKPGYNIQEHDQCLVIED
uniref:Uncharacterized protein n=1 Tax=Octopus bimaculoides TaxID=37653 RepID=A0A0L8FY89_OCTBM